MPQSMQQKREGSLKRLTVTLKRAQKDYELFPGTGTVKERRDAHVANLRRVIEQTKTAITRNR